MNMIMKNWNNISNSRGSGRKGRDQVAKITNKALMRKNDKDEEKGDEAKQRPIRTNWVN